MTAESSVSRGRAWVEIDLGALRRNAVTLRARAGVPLLPMVKADAYGLGAPAVARALDRLEPWGFGVASVAEAATLRAAGITRRILTFTPLAPEEFAEARAVGVTPTLGDPRAIGAWVAHGGAWHLAIDTGMHRAGLRWDAAATVRALVAAHPPEGVCTHYHSAELDDGSLAEQDARFDAALEALGGGAGAPWCTHTDNSGAIVRRPRATRDLVRPGVFLYGVGSGAPLRPAPVAALRGRILELHELHPGDSVTYGATWRAARPSRVATIGVGYADGYRRQLSNRGHGLLHGRRVPVVGTVTMDMTVLDVTDVPCAIGDVVTLLGADGPDALTAEDVASWHPDLNAYEVLVGLALRLPQVYRDPV